jgi:hypothetical protein
VSRETVIARAQAAALQGMVDTCTVQHKTGEATDATWHVTPTYSTTYAGVCKVQQRSLVARPENVGEAQVYVSRLELHLPMTAVGVVADDLVTITASLHTAAMVGTTYRVRALLEGSWRSALRFEIIQANS